MRLLRVVLIGLLVLVPVSTAAQQDELRVRRADGSEVIVPVRAERGHAVVADGLLEEMGWRVEVSAEGLQATRDRDSFALRPGSPFFRWNGELLQFVSPPYAHNGAVWIPLQLFLDFLPARMGDRYSAVGPRTLAAEVGGVSSRAVEQGQRELPAGEGPPEEAAPERSGEESATRDAAEDAARNADTEPPASAAGVPADESAEPETRGVDPTWGVVVIDPGHGGRDPGAIGPGGRREKDVALAVGRALARELAEVEGLEVRMTRDRDRLIPIWERGHLATEWKGDRPGVFISIHTNSVNRSSVRGFETYFLSEARTEHEARVAENENAPLALRGDDPDPDEPGLDFILRDLRNRDYQNRSAVLAEEIQLGMERIHPGPNRGVKQAPLAVITNALMPAVLVEVGFITNPNEERLLSRGEFQRELAREIAGAVRRFFERYPPEAASGNRP